MPRETSIAAPVSFIRWILLMASWRWAGAFLKRKAISGCPGHSVDLSVGVLGTGNHEARSGRPIPQEAILMRFYNQQHRFYAGGDLHARSTPPRARSASKCISGHGRTSDRHLLALRAQDPSANNPGAEAISERSSASWSNTARRRKKFVRAEGTYLDFRGHITVRRYHLRLGATIINRPLSCRT